MGGKDIYEGAKQQQQQQQLTLKGNPIEKLKILPKMYMEYL